MNFDFLKGNHDFKKLYEYCSEAEEFVYSKPNISATAARKAMVYLVKFIYTSILGEAASNGLTAFEMITDARFTDYINDPTVISSIHYIRKMGNVAVHDGTLTNDESMKVLEELQFLVGETAILLGLCDDYPQFSKNIAPTKPASRASVRQQETKKEKIIVEPELVALKSHQGSARLLSPEALNRHCNAECCHFSEHRHTHYGLRPSGRFAFRL